MIFDIIYLSDAFKFYFKKEMCAKINLMGRMKNEEFIYFRLFNEICDSLINV